MEALVTARQLGALVELSKGLSGVRLADAIASRRQVSRAAAYGAMAALAKTGLLEKSSYHGYTMLRPSEGLVVHGHSESESCRGVHDGDMDEALAAFEHGSCTVVYADDLRSALAKEVRGVAIVHKKRKGRPVASSRAATVLLSRYASARRASQPDYEPTRADKSRANKAATMLKRAFVGQQAYQAYIAYAFLAFARITARDGRKGLSYPPTAFLTSESIIDGFVSTLGRRRVNVERLAELLEERGYQVSAAIVASIGRRLMEDGVNDIPGSISPKYKDPVAFFVNHFDEIGYEEA